MDNIKTYQNGNYMVSIDLANGTKTRENDFDFFKADFPECCDYKITNNCAQGCSFCHENSTSNGKHGDILGEQGIKVLESFHEYTELAIGGGDPLSHPDLIPFFRKCKELNLIPNMTVHQFAFMKNQELIEQLVNEKLIYGIGVSLVDPLQPQFLKTVSKYPNLVLHVITSFRYVYEGETYAFEKEDETWYYADDHSLNLNQDRIKAMILKVAPLKADQVIGNVTDMSQYGLADPERTIQYETADRSVIINVGNLNSMTSQYYIAFPSEMKVYVVATNVVTGFNYTLEDLVEVEETAEETESTEATDTTITESETTKTATETN